MLYLEPKPEIYMYSSHSWFHIAIPLDFSIASVERSLYSRLSSASTYLYDLPTFPLTCSSFSVTLPQSYHSAAITQPNQLIVQQHALQRPHPLLCGPRYVRADPQATKCKQVSKKKKQIR